MRLFGIVLALVVGACTSAPPSATDKGDLARRLAELQNPPEMMRGIAKSYVDEYLVRLPDYNLSCPKAGNHVAQCNALADEIETEIRAAFEQSIVWTDQLHAGVLESQIDLMIELYSRDELAAAVAFSESPHGRSMLAKMPAANARQTADVYRRLRPWVDLLGSQIDLVHEKYAPAFEALLKE